MFTHEPGERWSPWWAIVLVIVALVPPGWLLISSIGTTIADNRGGGALTGLGPPFVFAALLLVAPGIDYLIRRRRSAFLTAMLVAVLMVLFLL